jgi:hypothetical protein
VTKCAFCRGFFSRRSRGRPARYCRRSCRQRAYERRHSGRRVGLRHQPTRAYRSDDCVMTPPRLARALVAALQPTGVLLEPCAGTGNFVRALRPHGDVRWCEISRGRDFFEWVEPVDEIITNPPWSQFRRFLDHALRLARRRVALVATVNHFWTRHRRELVRRAGFGIEAIIEFPAPPEWHATGFQLGMVVLTRGHAGPCAVLALPSTTGRP